MADQQAENGERYSAETYMALCKRVAELEGEANRLQAENKAFEKELKNHVEAQQQQRNTIEDLSSRIDELRMQADGDRTLIKHLQDYYYTADLDRVRLRRELTEALSDNWFFKIKTAIRALKAKP